MQILDLQQRHRKVHIQPSFRQGQKIAGLPIPKHADVPTPSLDSAQGTTHFVLPETLEFSSPYLWRLICHFRVLSLPYSNPQYKNILLIDLSYVNLIGTSNEMSHQLRLSRTVYVYNYKYTLYNLSNCYLNRGNKMQFCRTSRTCKDGNLTGRSVASLDSECSFENS